MEHVLYHGKIVHHSILKWPGFYTVYQQNTCNIENVSFTFLSDKTFAHMTLVENMYLSVLHKTPDSVTTTGGVPNCLLLEENKRAIVYT